MDSSDDENSAMFKVDHNSEAINIQQKQRDEKLNHFFNKETEIIKEGERRKVIYGAMEK